MKQKPRYARLNPLTGLKLLKQGTTCSQDKQTFLDLGPGGENETAHTSPPCRPNSTPRHCNHCSICCCSCHVVVTTTLVLHSWRVSVATLPHGSFLTLTWVIRCPKYSIDIIVRLYAPSTRIGFCNGLYTDFLRSRQASYLPSNPQRFNSSRTEGCCRPCGRETGGSPLLE